MPIFRKKNCIHTTSGTFALCKCLHSTLVGIGVGWWGASVLWCTVEETSNYKYSECYKSTCKLVFPGVKISQWTATWSLAGLTWTLLLHVINCTRRSVLGSRVLGSGREAVVGSWEYLVTGLETVGTRTVCMCACISMCLYGRSRVVQDNKIQ